MQEEKKIKGLGDVVEVVTVKTGIKKLMPKDCGCNKRKEKLNKLVPFKNGGKTKS